MSVGPFFGAYLEIFGGYAKASNWLMPVYSEVIRATEYSKTQP